jgi:hypothetical protein
MSTELQNNPIQVRKEGGRNLKNAIILLDLELVLTPLHQ